MTKKSERQKAEEYQDEAAYWGKEDPTQVGKKAVSAAMGALKKDRSATLPLRDYKSLRKTDMPAVNAAADVVRKDKEQREPYEKMNAAGDTFKKGGKVSSASIRGDGCATKGKTKGRII